MDKEFFTQRLQCSRTDRMECLPIVRQLMELATCAHHFGLLEIDKRVNEDPVKYSDAFLRKSISCIVDINDSSMVKQVLYNYIASGNYTGQQFLKNVVITETVLAIQRDVDHDHIFSFLVPSLFGLSFENSLASLYRDYKKSRGIEETPNEKTKQTETT